MLKTVVVAAPDERVRHRLAEALAGGLRGLGYRIHVRASEDSEPYLRDGGGNWQVTLLHEWATTWRTRMLGRSERADLEITTRGWLDLAVDPTRFGLPRRAVGSVMRLSRLAPKPDLCLLLMGEPGADGVVRCPDDQQSMLARWRAAALQWPLIEVGVGSETFAAAIDVSQRACLGLLEPVPTRSPLRKVLGAPARVECRATTGAGAGVAALLTPMTTLGAAGRLLAIRSTGIGLGRRTSSLPLPLDDVLGALGADPDDLAVVRSHSRRRWLVASVIDGTVTSIIKVVQLGGGSASGDAELRDEARMLELVAGRLDSVRTPTLLGYVETDGWAALEMEFCLGSPVRDWPPNGAVDVAVSLARARGGHGVTHNDLKPSNLLRAGDRVTLVDWESASSRFVPGHDLAYFLQQTGALDPKVGPRVDAWSFTSPIRELFARYLRDTGLDWGDLWLEEVPSR